MRTRAVIDQMKGWEIMKSRYKRNGVSARKLRDILPLEPREDYSAYLSRVNRSVFTPYTQRLLRQLLG